ncbi:hypothetical protein [Thermococcus sp.]|uniref:hypothetical protein n=1 Tax=Thermococcus sp. TaxID=35749 RepID=UPI00261487E9|nr:hypothetical protein [Thermococcus sp.]
MLMETLLTKVAYELKEGRPKLKPSPLAVELNGGPLDQDRLARLERLYRKAMSTPAKPMKGSRAVVVAKRGDTIYFRRTPEKPPTEAKRKAWEEMAKLAKLAGELSHEEVAELVGGEVVDVGRYLGRPGLVGKKAVLVDGQLLTKSQAMVKLLKGKRWARPRTKLDKLLDILEWALE